MQVLGNLSLQAHHTVQQLLMMDVYNPCSTASSGLSTTAWARGPEEGWAPVCVYSLPLHWPLGSLESWSTALQTSAQCPSLA